MKEYSIRIFFEAENDLDDIADYLASLSEQAAIKYYDLIVESIASMKTMPECCPLVRDTQLRLRGYRTLRVKNYIVFYLIKGDAVEIRRILYARRQCEGLL